MRFVCNAFSLQMVKLLSQFSFIGGEITEEQFKHFSKGAKSFVGHKAAAEEMGVEYNRDDLLLSPGDLLFVRQLSGKRLPEGVNTMPDNVEIKFYMLIVEE